MLSEFLHYINVHGKKLKLGYTTGSTATLAAKASAIMLLTNEEIKEVSIVTPRGIPVDVDVFEIERTADYVSCSVVKNAGDDVDATHNLSIFAKISLCEKGINIDGGVGVGRVTKKGLDQPIDSPAINSMPRKMITKNLLEVCEKYNYNGGFNVEIYVPNGEQIATKTQNFQLGIVGGISILGTTGIVEPRSLKALVSSIEVEMNMLKENNVKNIIVSPGNYSDTFLEHNYKLEHIDNVKCSNFIGDTLDFATVMEFENVLLIGHIGKFCKLAANIMNTHSKFADGRTHIFATYAALAGCDVDTISKIMNSVTADACIEILKEVNKDEFVLNSIVSDAQKNLERRTSCNVGIIMFSNFYGFLGQSENALNIVNIMKNDKII